MQQNEIMQQAQKHHPEQDEWHNSMEISSVTKKAASTLGGLFDILQPSPVYDENQAEVFRKEAKKRRKKKASQYRQRL